MKMNLIKPYAISHFQYQRILTKEVNIGGVPVGGRNPIRIQSMTTTDTMDTKGTIEQTLRMVESGCEYVRITAPSKKEAENLAIIKKGLRDRGCMVPLVADIHYTPNAAEIAARIVEKVRVNPGNYADKKRFETIEYTDESYHSELQRIYERFSPLVKICKEYGTAMRIGTNHGSLSDRIMSRYGDTPLGMVESAMEFLRICEDHGYYDIVISMKASNPQVMVQAYRMLMQQMLERDMVYPLHLGVTEAGEGEDGRIKSALGIGTLLLDGIGDTVRVSLTEEPEYESPVADFLVKHFVKQANTGFANQDNALKEVELPFQPFEFKRKKTKALESVGNDQVPRIVAHLTGEVHKAASLQGAGYTYIPALDKYNFSDIAADFIYLGEMVPPYELPGGLNAVIDANKWGLIKHDNRYYPYFTSPSSFLNNDHASDKLNFISVGMEDIDGIIGSQGAFKQCVFVLKSDSRLPVYDFRKMIYRLIEAGIEQPVFIQMEAPTTFDYYEDSHVPEKYRINDDAKVQLHLAADMSTLLVDGLIEGIWITDCSELTLRTAFNMLQMSRLRITKTEYISCPSCGRTLFDLQETTARIRKQTEHLKGVKIGIMGCIVNGPGEMADADYGYVGVGPDKIALYRGQEVVERGVRTKDAVDKLIDLIKEDGNWVEGE